MGMTNFLRLSASAAALVLLAACSSQSAAPALSDDLKQDLARVGGGDVQLASAGAPRLEVVGDVERTERAERTVVAPRAPAVVRTPTADRGTRAVVRSVRSARRVTPAPAPAPAAIEAEAEAPRAEPAPEPVPSQQRPQRAPLPSTQREPVGGWRTPGEIIRNAPFPIKPVRSTRW